MLHFSMIKFLWIAKFREFKKLIKNLWMGILILLIVGGVFFIQLRQLIILNSSIIENYKNIFFHFFGLIAILILLFKKEPFLKFYPATMIYFYGYKMLDFKLLIMMIKNVVALLISFLMILLLHYLKINHSRLLSLFQSWDLIMFTMSFRYFKETKVREKKAFIIMAFVLFLIWNLQFYLPLALMWGITIGFSGLIVILIRKIMSYPFDYGKVYDKNVRFYKIRYATLHNKMDSSQSFVRETSIRKSKKLRLLNLIKNPLIKKNMLAFYRSNFTITVYILIIYFGIAFVYRSNFLGLRIDLERLRLVSPILAVHQSLLVTNIMNVLLDQYMVLQSKSKEGLFLPYTKEEIVRSFLVLGIIVIFSTTLLFNLIINKNLLISLIEIFAYTLILYFALSIRKMKKVDLIDRLIYFLVFGVTLFLIRIS